MINDKMPSDMLGRSGIQIENFYSIKIQKNNRAIYGLTCLHLLLLIASVLSSMYCLITGLNLDVDHRILILSTIVCCFLFWIIILMMRYAATMIPVMLFIFTLYLNERLNLLVQGLYIFLNYIIHDINEYYSLSLLRYVVTVENQRTALTIFMFVIVFFYVWFYSFIIYYGANRLLYYILAIVTVFLPCIVGRLPSTFVFLTFAITMFGIHGIFAARRVDSKEVKRTGNKQLRYIGLSMGLHNIIIITLVLILLCNVITENRYQKIGIMDLKKEIQEDISNANLNNMKDKVYNVFRTSETVGGLKGGELDTNDGEVTYNHSNQLTVTMVKPLSDVYLKGFTGVNYTGGSWSEATESQKSDYEKILGDMQSGKYLSDDFSILNLQFLMGSGHVEGLSVASSTMHIKYEKANRKFMYYPYYTWFGDLGGYEDQYDYHKLTYAEEQVTPQKKNSSYLVRYYDLIMPERELNELLQDSNSFQDQMDDTEVLLFDDVTAEGMEEYKSYQKYEKKYRKYVYETYLSLPETGAQKLIYEVSEYTEENGPIDVLDAVQVTRDYLREHTDYTLTPGTTPKGEDYIDYFLYENHLGYCAHYASAATIMLRSMGIPARYVEGYHIDTDTINNASNVKLGSENSLDQNKLDLGVQVENSVLYEADGVYKQVRPEIEVEVDDTCAHAWVEIYLDGFGWYPVEFTKASSGNEDNERIQDNKINNSEEPNTEDEPEEEENNEETKEDKTQNEDSEGKNSLKDDSNLLGIEETSDSGISKKAIDPKITRSIIIIIVFSFFLALVYALHRYRRVRWSKYLNRYSNSQKYIKWYQRIERLRNPTTQVENLSQRLSLDEWQSDKLHYYGVSFETASLQREYYLKAAYSKDMLTDKEFAKAKRSLQQMYQVIYASKPLHTRLWYKYYIVISFGEDERV